MSTTMAVEADPVLVALQALQVIAARQGKQISFVVTPEKQPAPPAALPEDELQQRKQEDYLWLREQLTQHADKFRELSSNWVAVYQQQILACSSSREETMKLIKRARQAESINDVLIVPVCVGGSESDEEYARVMHELRLPITNT